MRARPFVATGLLSVTGVPLEYDIYVYAYSGQTVALLTYNNGSYVSKLAEFTATNAEPDSQWATMIQTDPLGTVSDGSIAWWGEKADTSHQLNVLDLQTDTEYTYNPPAGSTIFACMLNPVSGYLYWLEAEENGGTPGTFDIRTKRAKCDLTSQSTIGTETSLCTSTSDIADITDMLYSQNAILFFEREPVFEDNPFIYVHRVLLSDGSATTSALYQQGFPSWGGNVPSLLSADRALCGNNPTTSDARNEYSTATATIEPTATQTLPAGAGYGNDLSFKDGGAKVMVSTPSSGEIYTYPNTTGSALASFSFEDPTGSGYTTSDFWGAVLVP